jgi:GNAT superfamily N-acetyltransferase
MPADPHHGAMRVEVRSFEASLVDDAAVLLADRHRRHRVAAPGLDPAFEDVARARAEIDQLASEPGASGAAATQGGALVGFLLGVTRDDRIWGPNVWVESAGQAARETEVARHLYRHAAGTWVGEGRTRHYVLVPASDAGLVDAWFTLGFGQQHVHALQPSPAASFRVRLASVLNVRRAARGDIPAMAVLERVLPAHQAQAPVFSMLPVPALDDLLAELEANFDDPRFATFVAERGGRVVGSATGCSIEVSSSNTSLIRPAAAGFLGYAAVLPDERGMGAGRALGETVMAWSRDAGFPWVATDWRATNLEASQAWPRLGFRPTFLRLSRSIS